MSVKALLYENFISLSYSVIMSDYNENKLLLKRVVRRMKAANFEQGKYLEEHFIFDDNNETISYIGSQSVLATVLKNTKVL